MSARTRSCSDPDSDRDLPLDSASEVYVCKSCPDRSVFIESGNTDGWISSTVTVDIDGWE